MTKIFRLSVGLFYTFPFFLLIHIFAFFIGRKRSVEFWGPVVNFVVTRTVEIFLIPKIDRPEDFPLFCEKMKKNITCIKPLCDVKVVFCDDTKIIMNYNNCPHCEAFKLLGLPEVGPFICHGDWEIAERNSHVWDFTRTCQIGTGDSFCDHTYIRKKIQ